MANNLTGDYEAVLEISVRKLNAILATMHQRGIDPQASPSFAHSGTIQIGESRFSEGTSLFRNWLTAAVLASPSTGSSTRNARVVLSSTTPPGVSEFLRRDLSDLDAALSPSAGGGGDGVKGKADFQISPPRTSFPAGAVSEVTVQVDVRANYVPDRGSEALPAPIHGVIEAVYRVKTKAQRLLGRPLLLSVQVSPDDNQIRFIAANVGGSANLSVADQHKISTQVRKVLRKHFAPVDVELPAGFPFSEFKGLGGGAGEALVVPLRLDAPFPAGRMASLTNNFLQSNEFAIAVSKEYLQKFLDEFIAKIRAIAANQRIFVEGPTSKATYTISLSSASVLWKNGAIEISGSLRCVSDRWWAPDGNIGFTQSVAVVLDVPSQTVSVKPLGDPVVSVFWPVKESTAKKEVISARDNGIVQATASVNKTFAGARDHLLHGLGRFDAGATVTYTALEVTPDGIVVRGAIGASGRTRPVLDYELKDTFYTARDSWIPGGWIERYMWSWPEGAAWFSQIGSKDDPDRFVLPIPAAVNVTRRICLRIEGTRLNADGSSESVTVGDVCRPSWSEPILTIPPGFEAFVPLSLPRFPDRVLSDAIDGHLNIVAGLRRPNTLTPNTLVHFTGSRMERPLEGLSRALSQMRVRDHSVMTILVLPAGAFDHRASEVEARIGALGERFAGKNLLITEDFRGGWTKIFAAPDGPSTHLINARGEFVWNQMGALDGRALTAALDEHLLPAPGPNPALLRLTVQPGEQMPDTVFTDDEGNQTAVRRLRGENVLLNFWQSWSAPCIQELRRLQRLQDQERPPVVLAINGGEDRTVLGDVRGRHNFTFPLIHDPLQSIAMQYGVQCWPTTMSINREGIVDHVQFGLTHDDAYSEKTAGA